MRFNLAELLFGVSGRHCFLESDEHFGAVEESHLAATEVEGLVIHGVSDPEFHLSVHVI